MMSFRNATAVTTSDSTDVKFRALWVGGAGNLSVVMAGGQTVTFNSVPAGTLMYLSVTRVRATSTTATNIVGLN
jgi:hypothetical protein